MKERSYCMFMYFTLAEIDETHYRATGRIDFKETKHIERIAFHKKSINGKYLYRGSNRPSYIEYYRIPGNILKRECWYNKNNNYHRFFSPAIIHYTSLNKIYEMNWYHNGKYISKEVRQFIKLRKIKLKQNNYEIPDDHKVEFKLLFG